MPVSYSTRTCKTMVFHQQHGYSVLSPGEWSDITESVEAEEPPFTLGRIDGLGVLQFSVALYQAGPEPNPTGNDLLQMVIAFGENNGMESPIGLAVGDGASPMATGTFRWDDGIVQVWYVSDGLNFGFITYTGDDSDEASSERTECEEIVKSLKFTPRDSAA